VAVVCDGAIVYFADRPAVSILGKNDRKVAHERMRTISGAKQIVAFYPGHLKWDYAYSIGQLKPDVVAPGTWITSLKSESAPDDNAWLPIDSYYFYMGGTSQAGPHASGAAAVFVQYCRQLHGGTNPSPALVKAALITYALPLGLLFVAGGLAQWAAGSDAVTLAASVCGLLLGLGATKIGAGRLFSRGGSAPRLLRRLGSGQACNLG
jgi:hypothetical protein